MASTDLKSYMENSENETLFSKTSETIFKEIAENLFEKFEDGGEVDLQELVSDELDEIIQAEHHLIDVHTALESINFYDGVCRQQMISFEDALPSDYPLNSFTKNPTQTNREVAVITLENQGWKFIVTIAVAVASLILNLIRFILDLKKEKSSKQAAKDGQTDAREAKKAEEKVAKEQQGSPVASIRERINERANEKWNRYSEECFVYPDIFIESLFSVQEQVFENVIDTVFSLNESLKEILDNMEEAADTGNVANTLAGSSILHSQQELVNKLTGEIYKSLEKGLTQDYQNAADEGQLNQIISGVKNRRDELRQETATNSFDIGVLVDLVDKGKNGITNNIKDSTDFIEGSKSRNLEKRMKDLEKVSKELKGLDEPSGFDDKSFQEASKLARRNLKSIQGMILAIMNYSALVSGALEEEKRWYKILRNYRKVLEKEM